MCVNTKTKLNRKSRITCARIPFFSTEQCIYKTSSRPLNTTHNVWCAFIGPCNTPAHKKLAAPRSIKIFLHYKARALIAGHISQLGVNIAWRALQILSSLSGLINSRSSGHVYFPRRPRVDPPIALGLDIKILGIQKF